MSVGSALGSANVQLEARGLNCPVHVLTPVNTQTAAPSITWNGNVINNATQNAVVGQQIVLTGSPSGGTWSIGGSAVGGFSTGGSGGPITLIATSNPSVAFYWYTGGTNSVNYTVAGQVAGATFSVAAPIFNGIGVTPNTVNLEPPAPAIHNWMSLGAYPTGTTAGMYFTGNITPPSRYSGTLQWAQIINSMNEWFYFSSGSQQTCGGSNALDNTFPYPNSQSSTQTQAFTNDSPGVGLPPQSYQTVQRSDDFSMYLMWQPALSNAIPVPLGVVNWSWGGTAYFQSGTWVLHSTTGPSYTSTATSSWPSWTSTILNSSTPCGEPYHGQDPDTATAGRVRENVHK